MNKNEKSLITKNKITYATFSLIIEEKELSARSIAKEADISLGTLYYHFEDLNSIISAVIHEYYKSIYNTIDTHITIGKYLIKFMVAEILATISSEVDKKNTLIFAYIPSKFITTHQKDFKRFLSEYNIVISNELVEINSIILMNSIATLRPAILQGNIAMSIYEAMKFLLVKIFCPLGIPEDEINKIIVYSKELATKIKRIDFFPDAMKEKAMKNAINNMFLSELI